MKQLVTMGFVGCVLNVACAASAAPPTHAAVDRSAGTQCSGPVVVHTQADVRSIGAICTAIDGDLVISNTKIKNLDGLERLRSVRYVIVTSNAVLERIDGLRGLKSARGITLMGNPNLRSFHGLEGLADLDGAVIVDNGVVSLDGLRGLRSVRELVVAHNPSLDNLDNVRAAAAVADIEANGAEAPLESSRAAGEAASVGTQG